MSATEDLERYQRMIPAAANFDLEQMQQLCMLLDRRKKLAKSYLENPEIKEETIRPHLEEYNKIIKEFLGI